MYKNHYVCKVNHFFVTNKEKAKKAKKKAKSLTFCPCSIFVIVIIYVSQRACKGKNLFLNLQDNALVFFCPECKLVTIFLQGEWVMSKSFVSNLEGQGGLFFLCLLFAMCLAFM